MGLFFTEANVRRLLPMKRAIGQMRRAFQDLANGGALNQPRRRLVLPSGAVLHSMAGAFSSYFGTKIYSTHPRYGAHFLFALYRAEDATLLALFQANYLGQIRTGAASGLATDLLARPDAATLAVIGAGFQARSQLEAVLQVRPIRTVRVWSRTGSRAQEFARECSAAFGVAVETAASAERAVRDADIIVTATNSREPVLDDSWAAPGAHINAIGSNQRQRRELPSGLLRRAALIAVDSREQAREEAGDLLLSLSEDEWRSPKVVELQDIAAGTIAPPQTPGAVTIFKSLGIGVEDVAAAAYIYESAAKEDIAGLPYS